MTRAREQNQRGVALLLVLLSLILLSAIGLALMFSANTETSIAANYRDKQMALYAAQAGLQEARDRLNRFNASSPYYIPPPADMPTATHPENVIYILNPAPGETVDPWDSSSPYFDSALCNQSFPELANSLCSNGKPPANKSYTAIVNSAHFSGGAVNPYYLQTSGTATPLPYKWVRIMYKADNSTPVRVADSNAGTQVCWDEAHKSQTLKLTGYSPNCSASGGIVTSVTLVPGNDGGHGYNVSSPPAVTLSGGNGSGATATAIVAPVDSHGVASIHVDNPGLLYDVAPTVSISAPDLGGTQATATATISPLSGGPIDQVTLTTPGGCYQTNSPLPSVTISGGSGTGAAVSASMTGQTCVYSWAASGSCKAQAGGTVNVTGTGGFQSTITFKNGNGNVSATGVVTNGGSGLTPSSPPNLSVGGCTITPSFTYGYQIQSLNKTASGTNYSNPTVSIAGGNRVGSAPAATATTINSLGGQVISINITNPGSGYSSTPTVTFTRAGTSGAGAAGTAALGSTAIGQIVGFNITNAGTGYSATPTVTIAGSGGAQAVATVSKGDYKGNVFLVTAFARAKGGSIAIQEMEMANLWATTSSFDFKVPAGMTLAGPSPTFGAPSSTNMVINGVDANSCGETSNGKLPAIGVYNTTPPPVPPLLNADQTVKNSLPKPSNYIGINGSADVHDVSQQIGDPTTAATGLEAEVAAIASMQGANHITGDSNGTCSNTVISTNSCIPLGNSSHDGITVVDGNATVGPVAGYGILVVRGDLTMDGNFSWSGIILVIGDGVVNWGGGGNGQITGAIYVANTKGGSGTLSLGSPDANWAGGGGNGVQYDHCRADDLMAKVPFVAQPASKPTRILSMRTLSNQ